MESICYGGNSATSVADRRVHHTVMSRKSLTAESIYYGGKKENSGGSTFLAGSSTRQATTHTRHRCSAVMRRKSPDTTRCKGRHLSGVESKPDAAPSTAPARESTPIRQACRMKSSRSNVSSTTPHLAMSSGSFDHHQDLQLHANPTRSGGRNHPVTCHNRRSRGLPVNKQRDAQMHNSQHHL